MKNHGCMDLWSWTGRLYEGGSTSPWFLNESKVFRLQNLFTSQNSLFWALYTSSNVIPIFSGSYFCFTKNLGNNNKNKNNSLILLVTEHLLHSDELLYPSLPSWYGSTCFEPEEEWFWWMWIEGTTIDFTDWIKWHCERPATFKKQIRIACFTFAAMELASPWYPSDCLASERWICWVFWIKWCLLSCCAWASHPIPKNVVC